jgi:hypothetical protein
LIVIGALLAMTSAFSQQPDSAKPAPATNASAAAPAATAGASSTAADSSTAQTPAAPSTPSNDLIKKARAAGYRPQVSKGVTTFCKEEASLGSHFPQKTCISSDQLSARLEMEQQQRDQLRQNSLTAPGIPSH